jgi:hypothetical protein
LYVIFRPAGAKNDKDRTYAPHEFSPFVWCFFALPGEKTPDEKS